MREIFAGDNIQTDNYFPADDRWYEALCKMTGFVEIIS